MEHVTSREIKFAEEAAASRQLNRTEDSSGGTREGATTPSSKGVNPPSGKVFTVFILVFGLLLPLKRRNGPGERKAKSKATQRLRSPKHNLPEPPGGSFSFICLFTHARS